MNHSITSVCICGAGTMGSGIAQVFAQNGFNAILFDVNEAMLQKAEQSIKLNLRHLVEKNKISAGEGEKVYGHLKFVNEISDCSADLVIEAVTENISLKIKLFNQLPPANNSSVIFATNTSSLSISDIQKNLPHPGRVIGMHFFNPAPVMKLVEVVQGTLTTPHTIKAIAALCNQIGKTPVICKDGPGFIVNRVARHYYLEAMKLVEDGHASFETVDAIMEATGFRMGPFKLMDLIGMDVNLSVSESIYEGSGKAERLKPSPLQIEKVKNNALGKKTGNGFYRYFTP